MLYSLLEFLATLVAAVVVAAVIVSCCLCLREVAIFVVDVVAVTWRHWRRPAESAPAAAVTKETIIASPCRVVANVQELKIESTGWPRFRVTLDGIEQSHVAELALSMKPGRLPELKLTRLLRRSSEEPSVPGEAEKTVRHYD